MLGIALSLAMAAALAQAQNAAPSGPQKPAPAAPRGAGAAANPSASIPPGQVVITIHGLCQPAAKGGNCVTTITREQFEKVLSANGPANPNLPAGLRRNIAQSYIELMAFAQAATKAGIENDPRFQEAMRLARMQKLAEFYRRSLEEEGRNVSPDELQAYYRQNSSKYEEAVLSRIFLPRHNPAARNQEEWEKKAAQMAEDTRALAAKGGDFEKLQKDAYNTLAISSTPPTAMVGARRRGMLPAQEEEVVFSMKPGEVSQVIQEPTALLIYRMESKTVIPFERVKDEISREIVRQHLDARNKAVTTGVHADLDDKYFGPPHQANPAAGSPASRLPVKPPARPVVPK